MDRAETDGISGVKLLRFTIGMPHPSFPAGAQHCRNRLWYDPLTPDDPIVGSKIRDDIAFLDHDKVASRRLTEENVSLFD